MALRNTKSNLDNEEHEDLSFNHQQEHESDEEETKGEEEVDQSKLDDDTTKSPSVTAASNPTKKDSKKKIFNEKAQSAARMKKRKSRNMEIEKKVLNVLESLQESIEQESDDLFKKMVGEDLNALPPISKLQARNEIQNMLLK